MNIQGVECINDSIHLISHNGDIHKYDNDKLEYVTSLVRKDANSIKKKIHLFILILLSLLTRPKL